MPILRFIFRVRALRLTSTREKKYTASHADRCFEFYLCPILSTRVTQLIDEDIKKDDILLEHIFTVLHNQRSNLVSYRANLPASFSDDDDAWNRGYAEMRMMYVLAQILVCKRVLGGFF